MMESLAGLAMDTSAASFAANYSLSVTKKMMDTEELAAQELLNMLPDIQSLPKGQYIDTYA